MLVLHGIYGAGRNWASVARRFVRERPEWGALLVDLRLHGSSTGFEAPHTIDACAGDLTDLVRSLDVEAAAVLGHSFGGKVALAYLRERASASSGPAGPRAVWIVDSTPDARPPAGSAWTMLEVLRRHPGPFEDREAGVAVVEAAGFPRPVAQWMATNLVPGERADELVWRVRADEMEALLRDFFASDLWTVLEQPPTGSEIHLVKARESGVLDESAVERIRAATGAGAAVRLHLVDGGHWVNADNPDGLVELLAREL